MSFSLNKIRAFAATWDLQIILRSEIIQTKKNITGYHLHVESNKNDTNELTCKTETDSQISKLPKGKHWGASKLGNWDWRIHTTVAHRCRARLSVTEMRVQPLGREDPLKKELAAHSSILARKIPQTEEPGRLQSMRSQSRIWLSDWACTHM